MANYRLPAVGGALPPTPLAMFFPQEYVAQGLGARRGLTGLSGDILAFGQGARADFAYDGETVLHEFGHLVNFALAGLTYDVVPDEYGLCHLGNALEQGLAETFVFLVSDRHRLFEYLDQVSAPGFLRDVDNEAAFPDALCGSDQRDGLIVAGANWEAFQHLRATTGLERGGFGRLLVRTLQRLTPTVGPRLFEHYAESVLAELATDADPASVAAVRAIFLQRGLFEELRAKDLGGVRATDGEVLVLDSALEAPWNTTLTIDAEGDGGRRSIAPAPVQGFVDPAPGTSQLILEARVGRPPDTLSMYPVGAAPEVRLYVRHGAPVHYSDLGQPTASVSHDQVLRPEIEDATAPPRVIFTIDGLAAGTRTYLQPVNYGDAPAVLIDLEVRER